MNNQEKEFKDIIKSLELFRNVKPDEDFRARMKRRFAPAKPFAMPFFALRVALIVFLVLISGTSMVAVASSSKPGEALYPVKQLVDSVKTTFRPEVAISKAPTPPLQEKPKEKAPVKESQPKALTPTPTTNNQQKQTLPAADEKKQLQPTITPTPTPQPTQQQGVFPAVQNTVNQVIQSVPVLPIGGIADPTPTPSSQIEGSKDNGSNAGAGGSLLPKIKIGL